MSEIGGYFQSNAMHKKKKVTALTALKFPRAYVTFRVWCIESGEELYAKPKMTFLLLIDASMVEKAEKGEKAFWVMVVS
jgi:hypothetical protein